jgi:hypothetical protein
VQGQHAAAESTRLGARRDALAHGAPPGLAIDHDTARASRHVPRLLEQGAERGRGA